METSSGTEPRHWLGAAGGRRAAWRRMVLRRAASLSVLGLAALLILGRVEAATHRDRSVAVVAARELAAGTTLGAGDLREIEVDRSAIAPSAARAVTAVIGQQLAGPMAAGEQLTPTRLVGPTLLRGQPAGTVALWLPTQGDPVTRGLRVGSRVDGYLIGQREPAFRNALLLSVSNDTPESSARGSIVVKAAQSGVLVALDRAQIGDIFAGQSPESGAVGYALVTR